MESLTTSLGVLLGRIGNVERKLLKTNCSGSPLSFEILLS